MTDFHDMLRCSVCGNLYEPRFTATGRVYSHCIDPALLEALPFDKIDGGLLKYDVVDPILTESEDK
jgi:hypothetical protein